MATELEMMQLVHMRECLRKQLEEYELLQSIYSNPGEFQSDNPRLINEIQDYLTGHRGAVNEKLDFRIKLQINEKIKMELSVILSQNYPMQEQPMLIIRTDSLTKLQEKAIRHAIENYIETEIDKNDPYIFQVISWLQDNIDKIVQTPISIAKSDAINNVVVLKRIWLWSHHIYSKIKRQDIMRLSKDYALNGFMWPGKPGIICFEGLNESVEEVVKIVKGWQWQKLKIVKTELRSTDGNDETFYRFDRFNEILISIVNEKEPTKMDSGEFFKYLDAHKSANMKKELFGFE